MKVCGDEKAAAAAFPSPPRWVCVPGPVIIGAGPSGLAVAACLRHLHGITSLILEKETCIASLWQLKTYDRLRLHLPKQFCELPFLPFPKDFPTYPTRDQFLEYLKRYAERFDARVRFRRTVRSAEYDRKCGVWVVRATSPGEEEEYRCRWVVAATGENAVAVVPEVEGMEEFEGRVVHTREYRSGEEFWGMKVLVVGCGNSGMEVALDLCHYTASPFIVVRDAVHVLPQKMLGRSTYGVAAWMQRWAPLRVVDWALTAAARLMLGDTARLGLPRPALGPLQLKLVTGKTPVIDVGTLSLIRSGHIQVRPGIRRVLRRGVEFVDGRREDIEGIVLATGYRSNVPSWLKEGDMFSKDGLPVEAYPGGWKGEHGLYAVGFTGRGLRGASMDARQVADYIAGCCKAAPQQLIVALPMPSPSKS